MSFFNTQFLCPHLADLWKVMKAHRNGLNARITNFIKQNDKT